MKNNFKNIVRNSVFSFLILTAGPNFAQAQSSFISSDPHFQSVRWCPEGSVNRRIEGQRLIDKGRFDIERGYIKLGQREIAEGQALRDTSVCEVYEEPYVGPYIEPYVGPYWGPHRDWGPHEHYWHHHR